MAVTQTQVAKLILQEAGTFNIQYFRPMQINTNTESVKKFTKRIEHLASEMGQITPVVLAGMGEDLVSPQASPQFAIPIPQGWDNPRLRFVMEVHMTNTLGALNVYFVQGYTSHFGVSPSGHLDPNMLFYINSVFQLQRRAIRTPMGLQYSDAYQNCSHLLTSPSQMDPTFKGTMIPLRPVDLFTYLQAESVTGNSGMYDGSNAFDPSQRSAMMGDFIDPYATQTILDTRLIMPEQFFKPSLRSNNAPLQYLADSINIGVNSSFASRDYAGSLIDTISASKQRAENAESAVMQSDFMMLFNKSHMQAVNTIASTFKMTDILKFDPNLPNVTNYLALDRDRRAQLHQTGLTSHWNGSDLDTKIAVILANAAPAIMSDCLISRVVLSSTNHSLNGTPQTALIDARSLSNTATPQLFELFRTRFENELVNDFTYGNQIAYTLQLECDMFGETKITIATGSNPPTLYVVPSFCDSLISPVMNVDPNRIAQEAHSLNLLVDKAMGVSHDYNSPSGRISHSLV
jgi:hypothetical protein